MENLVYAELSNGITFEMLEDKKVLIISDTGIFIITTKENARHYKEKFYTVGKEARKEYGIEMQDGRIFSRQFPRSTF